MGGTRAPKYVSRTIVGPSDRQQFGHVLDEATQIDSLGRQVLTPREGEHAACQCAAALGAGDRIGYQARQARLLRHALTQ